jgi:CHAP domain
MDIQGFINRWNGKAYFDQSVTELPANRRAQCVSLIKIYLAEMFQIQAGYWGDAREYWENTNQQVLQKFSKEQGVTPELGDIVIFKPSSSNFQAGHIGIAVSANQLLEQNGATGMGYGTGGDAIRIRTMPGNIYGILRPRGIDMITDNDIGILRIAHSEIGGWDSGRTHRGEFDKLFLDAWRGKNIREMIWNQWIQGRHREDPTIYKQQTEALRAQIEKDKTLNEAEIMRLQKALEEKPKEIPVYVHDEETKQNVNKILSMVGSIYDYFKGSYKSFSKFTKKDQ